MTGGGADGAVTGGTAETVGEERVGDAETTPPVILGDDV
jgi:hypothetical protein